MDSDVAGTVRLGTPEDFATAHLQDVLACFARAYPRVALEVNCDFTVNLLSGFLKGQYDLILFKREPQGPVGGVGVWREVLVWVTSPRLVLDPGAPCRSSSHRFRMFTASERLQPSTGSSGPGGSSTRARA
ncbi:LysR substrate-binding domain-containing protein [Microvirga guangxiensis]|uniref:LysR substrate binding domain-containing protein n=1 Tax=Microvirga guangxiensis TaxID=549386 RepID=A0A1G5KCR7_9HYPH|nr:LysR substrate binding domain-containing protein [Microvirga guangxiensis]